MDSEKRVGQLTRWSFFLLLSLGLVEVIAFGVPAPSGLMCELLAYPETTTFGDSTPEFSWIVNSDMTGDRQTAYQIMVATTQSLLDQNSPDKWDSTKTTSIDSINVSYAGSALSVNQSYFWKVRIWNKLDQVSDWSAIQEIKTGSSLSGYSMARYKQVGSEISPVNITKIGNGHYLIDFGKDAFGYIHWTIPQNLLRMGTTDQAMIEMSSTGQTQAQSSAVVEVHFGEKLENGLVDRTPGGTIRYYQTTVTVDGPGSYEVHPPGTTIGIAIPAEFGRIAPFRYVELVNSPYTVTTNGMKQISVHYPFDDTAASFQSDDQILNDVWELCRYSMKPTSFCAVYVDGDRERKPYEADAYINQLSHYAVDREFTLARYSHEYLMDHSTWPTEWKQHSIMMAWVDYLYTGNSESLVENYDDLKNNKLLRQHARSSDGLINPPTTDIVDWPSGERDGYVFKPINTVVNAFYYHTLIRMKQIAETLGYTADALQFEQDAAQVYQSFQTVFLEPEAENYYIDGEGTTHASLHANMFALAFGLVPENKKSTVVDFVKSRVRDGGMACSVYGAQYLLEALYLSGEEDHAMGFLVNTGPRSWVNMMNEGSTITMEAWGIAYKGNQDWNHAWGAAPANIISRFVAGIRPLEPGFAKTLIHPQPSALDQFQIQTPTIRGAVSLSMDKQADGCSFQIIIPANMVAKFVLPKNCDGFTTVTLDSSPVTPQQQDGLRFIDPITSGSHTIVLQ